MVAYVWPQKTQNLPIHDPKTLTMDTPPNSANLDEYSAAATLIPFDRPIPLLRRPVPAAPPDDPFVLAFQNPQSWSTAYKACELQITQQCDAGARIGCSINASTKCSLPWWKNLIGASKVNFEEREKCEDREMAICVEASKEKCRTFAKDKCWPAFRDARIAVLSGNKRMNWGYVSKLIAWVSTPNDSIGSSLWRLKGSSIECKSRRGVPICRGSDLVELGTKRRNNEN